MNDLQLDVWRDTGGWEATKDGQAVAVLPSDGSFDINIINTDGNPSFDEKAFRQTESFKRTIGYIIEHQQEIFTTVLSAIKQEYDKAFQDRDAYGNVAEIYVPEVRSDDDLKKLISPQNIHIRSLEKDGFHPVGYEFDCSWDEEHGVGVMVYKSEVERSGQADVTF